MPKTKYKAVSFSSEKKSKQKSKKDVGVDESDLEARMGISFTSQFNYESAISFDSIFSYGSQESPSLKSNGSGKFKYPLARTRREEDCWGGDGTIAPKDSLSVTMRHCLILVSAFILLLMFPILGWICVKRVKPNERLVVYRLGQRLRIKGPGLTATLPLIDKEYKVNVEETFIVVASLSGASKDGGLAELEQIQLFYQVDDPVRAVTEVRDLNESLRNLLSTSILNEMRRFNVCDISNALSQMSSAVIYTMNDMCTKWGVRLIRASIGSGKVTCDAPPPTSFLSKIDFTAVGRQLSLFAPLFHSASSGSVTDTESGSPSSTTTAISGFFEKLEEMKQLALQHQKELSAASEVNSICSEKSWFAEIESFLNTIDAFMTENGEAEQLKKDLGHVVYQFKVVGDVSAGHNDHILCYIDCRQGHAGIGEVQMESGDVHICICVTDLLEIIHGKGSTIAKVLSGRIQIRGDLSTASKLQVLKKYFGDKLFDASICHVPMPPTLAPVPV